MTNTLAVPLAVTGPVVRTGSIGVTVPGVMRPSRMSPSSMWTLVRTSFSTVLTMLIVSRLSSSMTLLIWVILSAFWLRRQSSGFSPGSASHSPHATSVTGSKSPTVHAS